METRGRVPVDCLGAQPLPSRDYNSRPIAEVPLHDKNSRPQNAVLNFCATRSAGWSYFAPPLGASAKNAFWQEGASPPTDMSGQR